MIWLSLKDFLFIFHLLQFLNEGGCAKRILYIPELYFECFRHISAHMGRICLA